ncbi:MAG: methyltransferase domain-containing protein [Saprospirales bacterium]|nr:methyltransferase domain-containing protein [Saprospirales bacterium]MBK8920321.1 methyltransferase domain-containing protein [Saprospirales bacterium]
MNEWESRWQQGQTAWDLGVESPPLCEYAGQIPPENRGLRVLIPGCGNGYEAVHLLQRGFSNITMVDIAPTAVERLRRRLDAAAPEWPDYLHLLCTDFFTLEGPFGLILEQTFFCALPPSLRLAYARKIYELLAPQGKLAGVFFDRDFDGGPPFGGHAAEYLQLFEPLFRIRTMAPCYNSVAPRKGAELFVILEKTAP